MNLMVDLETLGTGENAMIVSIGACIFNEEAISAQMYSIIDIESCKGYDIDPGTVKWWMSKSDAARKVFAEKGMPLAEALENLCNFCEVANNDIVPTDLKVWGDGASFDNVILRNAYAKEGIEPPWKFWNDRCYRTAKNLFREIPMKREGTHHNALDDAVSQAKHLIRICDFEDLILT